MTAVDQVLARVLANEGGYVDNISDRGGPTNFGITEATARACGYVGPMRALPRETALAIYRKQYVDAPGYGEIAKASDAIAGELIDTGVNMGPKAASTFLQRALNGLNNGGRDYGDLVVDGDAGPTTLKALRAFLARRGAEGERRLLALLNALQGERYLSLCEGRVANETFLYGWLGRIAA